MKRKARFYPLIVFVLLLATYSAPSACAQGTAINSTGNPADSSAGLDVDFSDRGVLIPRLTTAERDLIQNPADGLIIFNKTTGCLNYFFNMNWHQWCGTCIPPSPPAAGSNSPLCEGADLYLTATFIPNVTYQWTGPNGFSSGQQNPVITGVTAAGSGVYSVTASLNGCASAPSTVNVSVTAKPSSAFSWQPLAPGINDNVTFTPVVSGATYYWTFQGGNPATSAQQNPVVQWAVDGTFNVSLVVTLGGCVSDTAHQSVTIATCLHGSQAFNYTGSVQTWTVPSCITSIAVDMYGAEGYGSGGQGGRVQATHPVTPGETIEIYVGGAGTETTGGWNGGGNGGSSTGYGGGGGASDIRRGGSTLSHRIIVAGGGGGTGSNCGLNSAPGGPGGGLTGGSGCTYSCSSCQYTGSGGTQSSGGIAGPTGHSSCGGNQNGSFGVGGSNNGSPGTGGGGGWYGGGSGCYEGAGGGSSYTSPSATGVVHTQGGHSGNGQVTITW